MNYKILIAEDDKDIREVLKLYLYNASYEVVECENGEIAYDIIQSQKIDMIIADIMMPRMNGYELIKRIRQKYNIPILVLSAKDLDSDKILGLRLGADDYLTKPFNPLEMVARVESAIRRYYRLGDSQGVTGAEKYVRIYQNGELRLDMERFLLEKEGVEISLTAVEYKILEILMRSPGRVYTKAQIYEQIHGEDYLSDDNTLTVHISRIREKIEDNARKPRYIKTIRGVGYKIEKK